jgi:hypothetical protein
MSRITSTGTFCIMAVIALLTVPLATAKKQPDVPSGPVPAQVLTGQEVFISYGESDADPGAPDLTYNEFYGLIKSWGKYELTSAPADADLVFEIRFLSGISDSQLRLSIVDPKTHVVLWPFIQHVESSSRETGRRKKFDEAMSDLVEDVKRVTSQPAAANK